MWRVIVKVSAYAIRKRMARGVGAASRGGSNMAARFDLSPRATLKTHRQLLFAWLFVTQTSPLLYSKVRIC